MSSIWEVAGSIPPPSAKNITVVSTAGLGGRLRFRQVPKPEAESDGGGGNEMTGEMMTIRSRCGDPRSATSVHPELRFRDEILIRVGICNEPTFIT